MCLEEGVESKLECVCASASHVCQAGQGGAEAWLGQATPEGR